MFLLWGCWKGHGDLVITRWHCGGSSAEVHSLGVFLAAMLCVFTCSVDLQLLSYAAALL